jgi:hypothetical protein
MRESPQESKKRSRPRGIHPFLTPEKRLEALRQLRGMWKGRKPHPIKEFEKIRKEWDRELPPLGE